MKKSMIYTKTGDKGTTSLVCKGHSVPHRLRGNSKAPSDHQLRGAEVLGLRRKIWRSAKKNFLLILW